MAKKEKKPTDKLADKTALTKFLQGIFGDAQKKILRKLWKRAQEINKLEPKYEKMSDEELSAAGVPSDLVRLSCGIESYRDLISDIEEALKNI